MTDIFVQSPRTRLSTTRARRLTVTGSFIPQPSHFFISHIQTYAGYNHCYTRYRRNTNFTLLANQYQEAQDLPLPFLEGNRPQVPTQPQTCSPRHHEGFGMLTALFTNRTLAQRILRSKNPHTNNAYRRSARKESVRSPKRGIRGGKSKKIQ
jgi:hypothetical protein